MTKEPSLSDTPLPFVRPVEVSRPLSFINIPEDLVFNLMMKIKTSKATGPDGIHAMILKNVSSLSRPLSILFNISMQSSTMPQDWKDAKICTIHKKRI